MTLSGIMIQKIFPGPPNYESIEAGDRPEIYWILQVTVPIRLQWRGFEIRSPLEMTDDLYDFQLVFHSNEYERFERLLGRVVDVKGTLFHGHTGHHKTEALLDVNSLSPRPIEDEVK